MHQKYKRQVLEGTFNSSSLPPDKQFKHRTTLSADSKVALQNGNITKMISQFNKLHRLFKQSTPCTKGQLHRHLVAMKQAIGQHHKLHVKLRYMSSHSDCDANSPGSQNCEFARGWNITGTACDSSQDTIDSSKPCFPKSERVTLSRRKMIKRKCHLFSTIKDKANDSLREEIYKHYYQKLTRLTKMRASPIKPIYVSRTQTWAPGFSPECDTHSYEEKFRNLMYKVKNAWKPRDYIERTFDYKSLFCRLCTRIMDCIKLCTSTEGDTLDSMDKLDNLFRIFRRFKRSSPKFGQKMVYRGGGPKKRLKTDAPEIGKLGLQDAIGKEQLSVPVVDSLSDVLRVQFKQQHGLMNVCRLHQASRTSGLTVSQVLKRFDLRPVPLGSHAVQIHFAGITMSHLNRNPVA